MKRVIGLPGETVEVAQRSRLHQRQAARREPYLPDGTVTTQSFGVDAQVTVPANHYWVMGDNRAALEGLPLFRRDHQKSDIVGRVFFTDLAAEPHRLHVAARAQLASIHSLDGRDHAVGAVAVDGVDAHPQHRAEVAHLLRVPRERAHARSGGTARRARPSTRVWCMFIASMPSSARSKACRSSGTAIARRRSECTSFTAGSARSGRSTLDDRASTPRAARARRSAARPRRSASRGVRRLHVDRALEGGPELLVDVGEARDAELGQLGRRASSAIRRRRRPRRTIGSWAQTTSPSAESHTSVSSPVTPASSARRKAGMRVLGLLEPGATVGERDRRVIADASWHAVAPVMPRCHGRRGPRSLKRPLGAAEGYGQRHRRRRCGRRPATDQGRVTR